jgi:type IV secretory pathway component VirB8
MPPELIKKIEDQQAKIDQVYISVEKTRKYFLWTLIITVALFVLPLIGLVFALPAFLSNYVGASQSLGL